MDKIKQFYFSLVNIGTCNEFGLTKNKQIKIININSIIWIHVGVFFSIHDYILNIPIASTIGHIITFFVMCLVLYLNHVHKSYFAKIIWLTFFCFSLLIFSLYVEPGIRIEYFLLILPAGSLCFFSKNTISYILIPVTIFLFSVPYYVIPVYPAIVIENFTIALEIIFAICTFLMVFYFKTLNQKNESLLLIEKDKVLSDKIVLIEQQKELKILNEFKSHFFVNLSHEIRTPLTLIEGYRNELDFKKSEEENKPYINVIDEQLKEIKNITNNILDLSKLDENKIILNKHHFSINQFLSKIYNDFKPLFDQKNIEFKISLPDNDTEVLFDFDLLLRSINNIINNALKFTSKNGKVVISAIYDYEGNLQIKTTDNGIGIAKNELNKVFDRFYQTKNHISKSKGSGIGLAFTKSIIEEHGFEIFAESEIDKTTTFEIKISRSFLNFQKENNLTNENQSSLSNYINHKTILLVDDHQQMRFYIKKLLKNYNVIQAENGKQALEILKTTKIDLLITDYMMPIMDGWTLVKKVKELQYTFPVFVITARVDSQGKLDMLRLGIDHYFTKPFYKEELLLSIQKSLDYYQAISEEFKHTSSPKTFDKETTEFEHKIFEVINKNIMIDNFGVEDIATDFNISSKTLTRKTKLYFGQTPNQLIIEHKLLAAKKLLDLNSKLSLKEIALQVGFKNTSYLKKRFQARFQESNT